jgi:hypothetical protein
MMLWYNTQVNTQVCVQTKQRTNVVNNYKKQGTYTTQVHLANPRAPKPQLHAFDYSSRMYAQVVVHAVAVREAVGEWVDAHAGDAEFLSDGESEAGADYMIP